MSKKKESAAVERTDSFLSTVTGIGMKGRDKRESFGFVPRNFENLSYAHLDDFYTQVDVFSRICNQAPMDSLKRGYTLQSDEDNIADLSTDFFKYLSKVKCNQSLKRAMQLARAYGGAACYLLIDDGLKQDQPVDETKIKSFLGIKVIDANDIRPVTFENDPLTGRHGEPVLFEIEKRRMDGTSEITTGEKERIHWTRIIDFYGDTTAPKRVRAKYRGWGPSLLALIYDPLRDYLIAWAATGSLMVDMQQTIYKLLGLAELIKKKGSDEQVMARLLQLDYQRSVVRGVAMDAEKESMDRLGTSLDNVPQTLDKYESRVSASSRYPVTVLFGRSPAGLNATGESDIRIYYDVLAEMQEDILRPALQRILRYICLAQDGPTAGSPINIDVDFVPLVAPTELETLQARKIQAEIDEIYVVNQIARPVEIAESRFGGDEYSFDTKIDLDLRPAPEPVPDIQDDKENDGQAESSAV